MKSYIVEQKVTAFVNRYLVYDVRSDGQKGDLLVFVEQKRLAFKEEIIFYSSEAKSDIAFRVKAEKVMDVQGKFMVTDSSGKQIGTVRKSFKTSLLRSTWEILDDNQGVQYIVQESSLPLAIVRRIYGFIPYLGEIPFFVKYHFDFVKPESTDISAKYIKTTRFRDHYELRIDDETMLKSVGWQTLIAQCVLLDALQSR